MKTNITFRDVRRSATLVLFTAGQIQSAEIFNVDFENSGLSAFKQVDNAGGTSFGLSTSGIVGNAGQVGGSVGVTSPPRPGAWLQPLNVRPDPASDISVSFDMQIIGEGGLDDALFLIGDLDGGNYFATFFHETTDFNEVVYYSFSARQEPPVVDDYAASNFVQNTWYSITCEWSASSETLTLEARPQASSSVLASYSVVLDGSAENLVSLASFTSGVQLGFGTFNDGARFDNIVVEGVNLPEPEPLRDPPGAVEVAPDGVWTWFNDERAIFHQGYLFSGYVLSDGQYGVSRYDDTTNTTLNTIISTAASRQADDHNNPSITVLPDNRLLVMYSKHDAGSRFFYRTSKVAAPSIDADWNEERIRDLSATGGRNTYNNTYTLSSEFNRIYNFHRHINFNPTISISNDDGVTWETPVHFIKTGTGGIRPYPQYWTNGSDRIDLIYTDGHPNPVNNSVYHMYYRGGNFFKTDGSLLKSFDELPIDHDAGERGSVVYQYSGASWGPGEGPDDWIPGGSAWTWDICYGGEGEPVCVFQVDVDNVAGPTDEDYRIYYYYARWTGSEWVRRFIAHGGRPLYSPQRNYGGGITIDPDNPEVVYISTNALAPFSLSEIDDIPLKPKERYEIYRGVTADGGLTFTWEQLTVDSDQDSFRPIVPANHGYDRAVVWFYGRYSTFSSYDCKVLAFLENDLSEVELGPGAETGGLDLEWVSSAGRRYSIEGSVGLEGFPYVIATDIESQGAGTSYEFVPPIDIESASRGFFRVLEQTE